VIQKGPYPACPSRNIPNLKVPGQVTDRMRPHLHQPEGEPRRTYIPGAPTVGNHRADTMDANIREAERWLRQGERDLVSARNSCRSGDFEWACFQAQQSAEKSLKALLYARGYRRILTHSVYELIREIGEYEASFLTLKSKAKALDAAYITTRYPDSIVGNLTPSEYYDREDAEECIEHADSICSAARRALAG
jgi:HEPN domain-containing protein